MEWRREGVNPCNIEVFVKTNDKAQGGGCVRPGGAAHSQKQQDDVSDASETLWNERSLLHLHTPSPPDLMEM